MNQTAIAMEYLFCCGQRIYGSGFGCNLKTATQIISFMGILISLPVIIGIFTVKWDNYEEVPIIFAIYKGIGAFAPILMFFGSLKMDFSISYIGYVLHTIYVYGLIIFLVFLGIFWSILILPVIIISPPYFLFYTFYSLFCFLYLSILMYFNRIYFSFTKLLGMGQVRLCIHNLRDSDFYFQPRVDEEISV